MDEAERTERVRISLRLKAGRHLAGRVDEDGKPAAMSVAELAEHPELVTNGISRNRLEEIEQIKTSARPMELDRIALALGLPPDWFEPPATRLDVAERVLREAAQVAQELRRAQEEAAAGGGGPGHRKPGSGGAGA
jgi:transcriptional regulator with XRE-family HTH domain